MSTWTYYNLKFADSAAWAAAVPAAWLGEDGLPTGAHGRALDVLGPTYTPHGTGADGMTVWQEGEGFCVNVALLDGPLPAGLDPYVIAPPAMPKHVWA